MRIRYNAFLPKRTYYLFTLFATCGILLSCGSDDDDELFGNWVDRSVFDGAPRSGAFAFTIGNLGYTGTGYDGDDRLTDFWVYNMDGNFWTQLAEFPGPARSSAVAFAISGNAYVGLGFDGDHELGDFYRYHIPSNTWQEISPFTGSPRRGAVAFSSETHGYVGTGYDGENDKKDFWKYDPETDTWTEVVGFGGNKRRDGAVFKIGNTVYLGTGISNGLNQTDFWAFDLESESWSQLLDLDEEDDYFVIRNDAVGFSIGDKGYFAVGVAGFGTSSEVWEYDPLFDAWEEKTEYEGISRQGAIAFYNGQKAFLALGRNGNLYLDDNREFFPNQEEDEDD